MLNDIIIGLMDHNKLNDKDKLFLCAGFDKIYFNYDKRCKNRQYFVNIFVQKLKSVNAEEFRSLLIYLYPTHHILDIIGVDVIKHLYDKLEHDNFNKILKIIIINIDDDNYSFDYRSFIVIIYDLYKNKRIDYHYMKHDISNALFKILVNLYTKKCIKYINELIQLNELMNLLINETDIIDYDIEFFMFMINLHDDKINADNAKYISIIINKIFERTILDEFMLDEDSTIILQMYQSMVGFSKKLIRELDLKSIVPFLFKHINRVGDLNTKVMFFVKFSEYVKDNKIVKELVINKINYKQFSDIDDVSSILFLFKHYRNLCDSVNVKWYKHMISICDTKHQLKLMIKLIYDLIKTET